MTARRRTKSARVALLMAALALIIAAACLAGCGDRSDNPSSTPEPTSSPQASVAASKTPAASPSASSSSPARTMRVPVFFMRGGKLGLSERSVPATSAVATAAITALCQGPTAAERSAGLSSALPPRTTLRSVRVDGGVATVDLTAAFTANGSASSLKARAAQLVYTLTAIPGIKAVRLSVEGKPLEELGGVALGERQTRANWRTLEPAIHVESPGVGATLQSPFTLSGTACAFEGSFVVELLDDAGKRLFAGPVQASRGAPQRGNFSKQIAFRTTASKGTLVVYEQSMEDGGGRLNEVRIPVFFAH